MPRSHLTPHSRRRDVVADVGLVLLAACFAIVSAPSIPESTGLVPIPQAADQAVSALGCAALLLRRRWPVPLAVVLLLAAMQAHYLAGPVVVAVFTVAAVRPWRVTGWVAALAFAPVLFFLWQLPGLPEDKASSALTFCALLAGAFGWGLFRRSRQQLVSSLRERVELAEADAVLRAERTRRATREEIAREMHDVLGHRLSLLSVHAGALEFNPGASPEDTAQAAGVIRENARLALADLREVVGVLRTEDGEEQRPQPELADVSRLVAEVRATGSRVDLTGPPDGVSPPPVTGRTAYRIVQEALTNVRKHAPHAPVAVRITGTTAAGITVEARNPLPSASPSSADQQGDGRQGLNGLAERVRLAGGTFHASSADGEFQLRAWLPCTRADHAAITGSQP